MGPQAWLVVGMVTLYVGRASLWQADLSVVPALLCDSSCADGRGYVMVLQGYSAVGTADTGRFAVRGAGPVSCQQDTQCSRCDYSSFHVRLWCGTASCA
jgi:hypothetical protein